MVTPIRASGAVEYRLRQDCAADSARQGDAAVAYRIDGQGARPVVRVGSGWRPVDRTPGVPVAPDELSEIRAVMSGVDPRTGERLVSRKLAVAPEGKVPALPLLQEMYARRVHPEAGSAADRLVGRMVRAARRDQEHTVPVTDAEKVARAAGVDIDGAYDRDVLDYARAHADARVEVGVRGWDLTLDSPKSVSVLHGLSSPDVAARIEAAHMRAVADTVAAAETWCSQGQRGQHGRGRTADRVATAGLIGTVTVHTTARPVAGTADPHLHAHVMLANLARGQDGRWGGIAAGGRELYRHVPALGELHRARLRHHLTAELGVEWERDPVTQRWEITGVPTEVRDLYSRRRDQAVQAAGDGATPAQRRAAARRAARQKLSGVTAESQQDEWATRARQAGHDPHVLVAQALGRPTPPAAPDVDHLTAATSATAWTRSPTAGVDHARLVALAADAAPPGTTLDDVQEAADRVAADATPTGGSAGQAGHRGAARYTAPTLSDRDVRAGRGPAATAAQRTVQAHQAEADRARARGQRLRQMAADARAHATRAWRPAARRTAEEEALRLTQEAQAAEQQAHHHADMARTVWRRAIDQDQRIAEAQSELRAWRQARAAVRLAATDRPPAPPTRPPTTPHRGSTPYRPPPHRRAPGRGPRGPDR